MSSNSTSTLTSPPPSKPIPISSPTNGTTAGHRRRSSSVFSNLPPLSTSPSSSSSSNSPPTNFLPLLTPTISNSSAFPRPVLPPSPQAATSPLAYFAAKGLSTSPTNGKSGFAGFAGREGTAVAGEDDDYPFPNTKPHHNRHGAAHRRFSTTGSWMGQGSGNGLPSSQSVPVINGTGSAETGKGSSLFRRFSLGGQFATRPPPSFTAPSASTVPAPAPAPPSPPPEPMRGRTATLPVPTSPTKKRGVSPMGERMLKGHFDGFGA